MSPFSVKENLAQADSVFHMTKGKIKSYDRTDGKQNKYTNLLQHFGRLQVSSWVLYVFMDGYCVDPILVGGSGWLWVVTGDYWVVMGDSCFQ